MSTIFNNKSGPDNENAREGIMYAFLSLIPFMWLCVVGTMLLGNAWIIEDGGHEMVYGRNFRSWAVGRELPRGKRAQGNHHRMTEDPESSAVSQG